ncbi:alpha-amylase family glycosyl hydrolase [Lutibacter sp. TH_r2]|uniref:alpha-amylase family glycosyl hydrolase n=1 Tax=Lutibacter sp. TH_r2 TaxID=3082083 RepID=UPI002953DCBE|nr:alpha-amylase family glycosyl hydrolase [Lutibacter sp. TH_r2]MDV7188565.1 alpha-amylase family glycosyl hydrolase [Lutibacter sp. TH_r2]
MQKFSLLLIILIALTSCKEKQVKAMEPVKPDVPFIWENANIYFMLTDRFNNGDTLNDLSFDRKDNAAKLRGFKGGDLKGVIKKIEEGYFTNLGVNAIWMTPIVEQIHGAVDEGTGLSYGFHGYWTKDWTSLDLNFGTKEDLKKLVAVAHKNGIRIVLDAVINHTGPVTDKDSVYPKNWVRTGPQCNYQDFESTVTCTLVKNLPDIKTESEENVELPKQLVEKWKAEGRYEQELKELDAFFAKTGYPKAPKYYIMKWLSDYITEFGIDGYRADTVKHTEANVWGDFKSVCDAAFAEFKKNNPDKVIDDNNFFLVGEIYNYGISGGKYFDFGDKKVNYFDGKFSSQINFEFKWNAAQSSYEELFSRYSSILNNELKGFGVLNYVSSHDDGQPFDKERTKPFESATKLLLCPGASQIYYGDESARPLIVEDANGDANLRSLMNWNDIENNPKTQEILTHWQKLGQFRSNHPSVGAGVHKMISEAPYVFQRTYIKENFKDAVIVGLDLIEGEKEINVGELFPEGTALKDAYSGKTGIVKSGKVVIDSPFSIVLLEEK